MIPLGYLREDSLFEKISILVNIPGSFLAWMSADLMTEQMKLMKENQKPALQGGCGHWRPLRWEQNLLTCKPPPFARVF